MLANTTPIIELDDYCFAYGTRPVLSHIDLSIARGTCSMCMGYNGSGKSTLLKALNGLVFPQQGTYRFDGEVVDEKSMADPTFAKRLHQRVGFVFQDSDSQLFCASVADEIAFGPRQMGLSDEEVSSRLDDVCQLLDICDLRGRAPYHLSGGEQKKVAIACILSMNPDVYCFDEPLNGLDAKTRSWLLGFLHQLRDAGKTLVIATHDDRLAADLADELIVFADYAEELPAHIPSVRVNL